MDKELLISALQQQKTIRLIALETHQSITNVRYWMKKFGLKPTANPRRWTDDEMIAAIKNSTTISEVLRTLGLTVRPGNFETVHRFIALHNCDVSHFTGQASGKGGIEIKPLKDILTVNSFYKRSALKRRLIKDKLIEEKCNICGQMPEWKGKKLVLVLDHINGINNDNRLNNLRLLCPNCNSQQSTFCGRNKRISLKANHCCLCNKEISKRAKMCMKCRNETHEYKRKIKNRPSIETLQKELATSNYVAVGKKYGVSDNAIRKWIKPKPYEKN